MANKYPIIVNIPQQVFEEIPENDNLNLSGCGIYDGESAGVPGQVLTRISTGNQFRWQDNNGTELKIVSNISSNISAGASSDFTIQPGYVYCPIEIELSYPAWIRIYDSASARSSDTRTVPGEPYPDNNSGFYTEIVTTSPGERIRLSPIPVCQSFEGLAHIRVVNMDSVTRTIETTFTLLTLYEGFTNSGGE